MFGLFHSGIRGPGLALAVLISTASWATAQMLNPNTFGSRVWSKADGLPDDSVTAVLQTRDGYLWVGTRNGLARFDGVRFSNPSLPGARAGRPWITGLCQDRRGRLWIGTREHGLYCLADGTLSHFQTAQGLASDFVTGVAADHDGNVWIGTHEGVDQWNGKRFRLFTTREGLPDNDISSVYVASSGAVWITTRSGVSVYTRSGIQQQHFDHDTNSRSDQFHGVYEDRQHNLWAYGDTYLVNLNENKRFNYFRGNEAAAVRIWTFYQAYDDRLWLGTSGRGLFRFTGRRFRPVTIRNGRLPSDVRAICEDREGCFWLGTDGSGLIQLRTERLYQFGSAQGLPVRPATCLAEDALGRVWASFSRGGLFVGRREHFEPCPAPAAEDTPQYVRSLCTGHGGTIWAGSLGAGLRAIHDSQHIDFTTADGISSDRVSATGANSNSVVWVGTADGGVYHFNGQHLVADGRVDGAVNVLLAVGPSRVWVGTDRGEVLSVQTNSPPALSSTCLHFGGSISSMCLDTSGRLWIGMLGAGLACLQGKSLATWSARDGLPDTNVFSVGADAKGNLWLTTGNGIYRVERADLSNAIHTGKFPWARLIESFPPGEMTSVGWPATLQSHGRLLWFATGHGVDCFNAWAWQPNRNPPPVYLQSVRVDGQLLKPFTLDALGDYISNAAPVRLSSNIRGLDFDFTALCFAAPDKVRFLYKLEGFDSDWIEGDPLTRRAHYGSLSCGPYVFRVIACNPDGIWNRRGASFSFVISPPLWQAPWALALYGLTAVLLVAAAVRALSHRRLRLRLERLEHSHEMARERMRIAQDMHDQIGSKLARISFLSEDLRSDLTDLKAPEAKVDSIATTSRDLLQSLDQMVWAVNPRNDTVEHLAVYLGQYAAEYFQNTSIQCQVGLPQHFPEAPLSADVRNNVLLAFKEALSNTLKHSGAPRVSVDIQIKNPTLEISIADNGSGFDPASPTVTSASGRGRERHGLSGMKRRLQSIGGDCDLNSAPGRGTLVVFRVPLTTPPGKRHETKPDHRLHRR